MKEKYRTEHFNWFTKLRDEICTEFEKLESEYSGHLSKSLSPGKFESKKWLRPGGGGGEMRIMHGRVLEKVGVNVSEVFGKFSDKFKHEIPGAEENPNFYACGISLVAHPLSPLVPAVHMNTRFIETSKWWFGGGMDLTSTFEYAEDTKYWHQACESACEKHNSEYYSKFKKECDDYFYLPHRKEHRGVGGIFYDYLNNSDMAADFAFTKDVGKTFLKTYPEIVRRHMNKKWTAAQKEKQLIKRGRYVEFNLLYDRGTKFGLKTEGNTEAILMSLPPEAKWP